MVLQKSYAQVDGLHVILKTKMILYSHRTVIKPSKESDISDIIEMYSEPDAFKFVKPFQGKSTEFFNDFLQKKIVANKTEVEFWTVRVVEQNKFIGTVNLNKLADSGMPHIGCHLRRDYWNKGYAFEILKTVLDYGINNQELNEIYGLFENDNVASKRLLEKLGFKSFEDKMISQNKVNVFKYSKQHMNIEKQNQQRQELNKKLIQNDVFFSEFGQLDDNVYSDGAIPKKYKELTRLSISVLTRCDECILYHLQGCLKSGAKRKEIVEAIKMGVIGGGSITYPSARYAIKLIEELENE